MRPEGRRPHAGRGRAHRGRASTSARWSPCSWSRWCARRARDPAADARHGHQDHRRDRARPRPRPGGGPHAGPPRRVQPRDRRRHRRHRARPGACSGCCSSSDRRPSTRPGSLRADLPDHHRGRLHLARRRRADRRGADVAQRVDEAIERLPAELDDEQITRYAEDLLGGLLTTVVVLVTAVAVMLDGQAMVQRIRDLFTGERQERLDAVGPGRLPDLRQLLRRLAVRRHPQRPRRAHRRARCSASRSPRSPGSGRCSPT